MFGHLDQRKYSSLPAWVSIVNFINLRFNRSYREDSESLQTFHYKWTQGDGVGLVGKRVESLLSHRFL